MERLLQRSPVSGPRDLAQSNFIVALRIAAFDGDQQLVAGLYGFAGTKRRERQNAFSLETDIEQDGVSRERNHSGFYPFASLFRLVGMALLVLVKNVFERLFCFCYGLLIRFVFWIGWHGK